MKPILPLQFSIPLLLLISFSLVALASIFLLNINSETPSNVNYLISIILIIIIITILSTIIFHFLITRRAKHLVNFIMKVADGDYTSRSNLSGNDEFSQLSYALDIMTTNFNKNRNDLIASEERLIISQKFSNTGSWEWNIKTGEIIWSKSIFSMFGLDEKNIEINYEFFTNCIHPDDRTLVESGIKNCIDKKYIYDLEHRIVLPNGEVRWIHEKGNVIRDESGAAIRMLGIVRDINYHKILDLRNEKILADLNFQKLAMDEHSIIAITDRVGKITYANSKFSEISGYSKDELIGKTHKVINSGYHSKEFISDLWNTINSGSTWRGEICNRNKNGDIYWVDTTIVPHLDNKNVPDSFVAIRTDITYQVLSKKIISDERELLKFINELQSQFICDVETKSSFNNILQTILAATESEFGIVAEVLSDSDKKYYIESSVLNNINSMQTNIVKSESNIESTLDKFKALVLETVSTGRIVISDNDNVLRFLGIPLLFGEQLIGIIAIANRIDGYNVKFITRMQTLFSTCTNIINAYQDNKKRNQLESQLQQSQKMESIGQLTGGIAHDFNNILASILGFTSLSLKRHVNENQLELKDYLSEVIKAGERARDLISQMLAFSRTSESEIISVSLVPMIKEVTKLLTATLPSSIQLVSQIEPYEMVVLVDPVKLHQVLMNLCINSRDSIEDNGDIYIRSSRILVSEKSSPVEMHNFICDSCHSTIANGNYIELIIQDTGSGITDDTIDHIFEPFFTTKDIGKGSGMGLSMVHGIIHQYGGHILINTREKIGTTFRILLPEVKKSKIETINSDLEVQLTTTNLNDIKILVVDDEKSVARFLYDLLTDQGADVTVTDSSISAFTLFSNDVNAFDLVITDQTMPDMTGVELAKKLKNLNAVIPIILCTGYSDQINEKNYNELGIIAFLTKPIDINKLLYVISHNCNLKIN